MNVLYWLYKANVSCLAISLKVSDALRTVLLL